MSGSDPAIVLVGPMGAGKTSIGRRVARELGVPFRDTDAMVIAQHGQIPEIFRVHGEPFFRVAEREAVREALDAGGVVSLGGGAVLDEATRADLRSHRVVFLTVATHVVAGRIGGGNRPMLHGDDDPVKRWQRIFEERTPWYEEVADVTVDTSNGPLSRVVEQVAEWSRTRHEQEQA